MIQHNQAMSADPEIRYYDIVDSTYRQAPAIPALWSEVEEAFYADTETTDAERDAFWNAVAAIDLAAGNPDRLGDAAQKLLAAIDSARLRVAERHANRITSTRTPDDPL